MGSSPTGVIMNKKNIFFSENIPNDDAGNARRRRAAANQFFAKPDGITREEFEQRIKDYKPSQNGATLKVWEVV